VAFSCIHCRGCVFALTCGLTLSKTLAGLGANLVSHLATARIIFPRALKELSTKSAQDLIALNTSKAAVSSPAALQGILRGRGISNTILPSLGASGAVYAMITLSAFAFPEVNVSLIFPPTPGIPIQYAVGGLVLLDIFGVWRRWKVFDHYAHLGGAAFGALYYNYGAEFWERMRRATR
jgi:rhomboid-like protein